MRLWDLLKIVKKIATQSIFPHKWLRALACGAAISTIISAYFVVQIAHFSSNLVNTFKKDEFAKNLNNLFFASVASLVFRYVPSFAYTYVMQYIMRREFVTLTRKYLGLSYEQFHKKSPGELRYLIFLNAYAIPMVTQTLVFELLRLLGMCFFMGFESAKTTNPWDTLLFVIVPVAFIAAAGTYLRRRLKRQKRYLKEQEQMSSVLYDKLINYELTKTYNLEEQETEKFYESTDALGDAYKKLGVFDGNWMVLMNCMLAVILVLLILGAGKGNIVLQLLLMYLYMSAQLRTMVEQFIRLMDFAYQIKYIEMDCEIESQQTEEIRLNTGENILQSEESRLSTGENELRPEERRLSTGENELQPEESRLNYKQTNEFQLKEDSNKHTFVFKNVNLFYQEQLILESINETILLGEKIAVVGPNGCGKSTFIKSLMGFIRNTGVIEFDGRVMASKSTWKDARKKIAYVPQNLFVLNESIISNLRLGYKYATESEIYFQTMRFGIHEEILSFPKGYNTIAGPLGNKLSGGQKQKLSLVRAALRDGLIFIFDEATAAMDKNYEKFLIDAIWANFIDKTIIMIVHGKDYLHKFNRLFFVNNGRIECTGSYEDLMASSENFRQFVVV